MNSEALDHKPKTLGEFLRTGQRLPDVVLILGLVVMGVRFAFDGGTAYEWSLPVAVLYLFAVTGRRAFRRNQRSVRAVFKMTQYGGWALAILLGLLGWSFPLVSATQAVYLGHVGILLLLTLMIFALSSYLLLRRWNGARVFFQTLGEYRPVGTISSITLFNLFSTFQRSNGAAVAMPALGALAVPMGMAISFFLQKSVIDAIFFVFFALLCCPVLMAVLFARARLQQKYLGGSDLQIVD